MTQTRTDPAPPMAPPIVFMRFRPEWAYIDGIREFGRFFCATTFGRPDLAERAGVVLQETLENAIKYSSDAPDNELELEISAEGDSIEFAVSSTPDAAHLSTLREELERLSASDPERAYWAAFQRVVEGSGAVNRLGLARARYEGGVELSMAEEFGGRVRITAVGKL